MEATRNLEDLPSPLAATSTDRCPNCGAQMAADQRYCINCGERRTGGGLRDALPRTQAVAATPPRRTRTAWYQTSSGSLIAGVATLLIALGVGVLIGRTGHQDSVSQARQPVQVVRVEGNGSGPATGAAATGAAVAAGSKAAHKAAHRAKKSAHKSAAPKPSHVAGASDIQKTAAKNGVKLPPPVVKVGGKCQPGAKGCQGGKFTGNFFGGG